MTQNKIFRCAVYTRKSTEEGLEQEFNSLHAQREACEAYIKSQKHEGWQIINAEYDDGGISGGTMERPGLRQLLEDIKNHKVDIIVVYKVDRLTRSLSDFAKMVEVFDANNVSFVSVTQQFNTTSSMGRLTLNVLLSFAQFEREVTGERIRDKIAASKKKGIFMGGTVPTGYDVKDRKLVVNQDKEAIQYIFQRYLELGCVRLLRADLAEKGRRMFSRGSLYHILGNPTYAGLIRHKDFCHPGQHESIIEPELWQKVQEQLKSNTLPKTGRPRKSEPSMLIGKLFDDCGRRLTPDHAHTNGKRYRYYKSVNLATDLASQIDSGWRLPAHEIELAVISSAQKILSNKFSITSALQNAGVPAHHIPEALKAVHAVYANPINLVKRVDLQKHGLRLTISLASLLPAEVTAELAVPPTIAEEVLMQMKRRGAEMRLVIEAENNVVRTDPKLIRTITRAHLWFEELVSGQVATVSEIARREKIDKRDAARILSLAFLAPDIVEAIIAGRQPANMTANVLLKSTRIPLEWKKQKIMLGFN